MSFSPLIIELMNALRCLPGVGPKTAQRMALHILQRDRDKGKQLASSLQAAIEKICHCERCRHLSEATLCPICANQGRDPNLLCIVESPMDVFVIEQTGSFRGYYFVLHGHLSPLDGIGPNEIGVPLLLRRLKERSLLEPSDINPWFEVIIATNPTVEGEATAHYLAELIKPLGIKATRLAHGIPLGGELEFIDSHTIARALAGRDVV